MFIPNLCLTYEAEYERIQTDLNDFWEHTISPEFTHAVQDLENFAQIGHPNAVSSLAEIRWLVETHRDREASYFWYFIEYYRNEYITEWDDRNGIPPYYAGPIGDFRNEAAVSDLVFLLGFERCQQLDSKAKEWLAARNIKPGDDPGQWKPTPNAVGVPLSEFLRP